LACDTGQPNEKTMKKLLILTALALAILGVTATVNTLFPHSHPIVIAECAIRAGLGNDLTTLSDRDLRDVGLVREQIGKTSKLFVLT
jgi:hypothetical protein